MAKTLLRSGCLDDFLSLGENGQTVFDSALQIRETLRLRKQQAVVDSLAIPQPNDEGDRVDWYAPFEGNVTSWAAASDEQRKKALRYLDNSLANVASLIDRCKRAEKTAIQLFGSLLAQAMQFPASQHIYLVDGKPVLTFWGFVNLNSSARPDPLDCLRNITPPEPVIEHLPEPLPERLPEPVMVVVNEPDEPLYSVSPHIILPQPEYVTQTATAQRPIAKKSRRGLLFAAFSVAIAICVSVAYYVLSPPAAQPLAQAAPAEKPPVVAAEMTLPVTKAAVVAPSVPEPEVPASTTPVEVPKNALLLPVDALKVGSTKFLNGNWRVLITVKDAITGKPPTLRYQIANNKGTVRLVHGDNVVCKAEVFSGLMQSGKLMIKSRGNARCSDGSRYPLPEISCKPGASDIAQCSGRYEGDTVVPVTFKKVSD